MNIFVFSQGLAQEGRILDVEENKRECRDCGFSILSFRDYVTFAKKHGMYSELCESLGIEESFFTERENSWVCVDFVEKFFPALFILFQKKSDLFEKDFISQCETIECFLATISRQSVIERRHPYFRFALSIFVDPKVVWKRLHYIVGTINRYNRIEYSHVQDSLLYSTGRVKQTYHIPGKMANAWLSSMCMQSIEGLADALGTTVIYVKQIKSVSRGDEYCEFEFRWIRKSNWKVLGFSFLIFSILGVSINFGFPGFGIVHSLLYSFLISVISGILLKQQSNFLRTDEAFHQQREAMNELTEREEIQRKLNMELIKIQGELEKAVTLAAAGETSYGYLHDMASSISVIVMSTKILSKNFANPEVNSDKHMRYLGMTQNAADRLIKMQNMIRRIVITSNNNSQALYKVNAALHDALEVVMPLADTKNIDVVVDIESTDGIDIYSSEGIVEGVVLNIMNNAINALESQLERRIELTSRAIGDDIQIGISDNGPGIPESVLAKMTDPFNVGLKSTGQGMEIASSGFGLYKIKRSVEALKGKIEVSSSNSGTVFLLTLPRGKAPEGLGRAS